MKNYLFLLLIPFLAACASDDNDPGIIDPPNGNGNGIEYTVVDPCLTATEDCLEKIPLRPEAGGVGVFKFYRNYPIMVDTAIWGNIRNAIIVVHGQNRDADNYFSYMVQSLSQSEMADSTLIIAPQFQNNQQAGPGELFWPLAWRAGALSGNPSAKISTYSVMDSLLERLSNKDNFPFLENIIITGHSSGALLTHAYAFATKAETLYDFEIDYIVANSQYFYYPQDVRYDPDADSFIEPVDCADFNDWPLGFETPVEYLASANREDLNDLFIKKRITYLLGTNDTSTTGTLNTDDCAAVLLGVHRFNRGENMFLFMETFYPGEHSHQKVLVQGVGHNGNSMYQSNSYKNLMNPILVRHR